ncbi:hypothetical protein M885DRAFT_519354 [Pelagophyceae sp. CCMP2097]|nr:hypothetical protein M885DRAFT_519354 [Pelagophyceae sp. CCMP2097]
MSRPRTARRRRGRPANQDGHGIHGPGRTRKNDRRGPGAASRPRDAKDGGSHSALPRRAAEYRHPRGTARSPYAGTRTSAATLARTGRCARSTRRTRR